MITVEIKYIDESGNILKEVESCTNINPFANDQKLFFDSAHIAIENLVYDSKKKIDPYKLLADKNGLIEIYPNQWKNHHGWFVATPYGFQNKLHYDTIMSNKTRKPDSNWISIVSIIVSAISLIISLSH